MNPNFATQQTPFPKLKHILIAIAILFGLVLFWPQPLGPSGRDMMQAQPVSQERFQQIVIGTPRESVKQILDGYYVDGRKVRMGTGIMAGMSGGRTLLITFDFYDCVNVVTVLDAYDNILSVRTTN